MNPAQLTAIATILFAVTCGRFFLALVPLPILRRRYRSLFDECGRSLPQASNQTVLMRAKRVYNGRDVVQFFWSTIRNHSGHKID